MSFEKIEQYIDSHRDETLEIYKNMILHESWAREPENVAAAMNYFKSELEKEGFVCKLEDVGNNGPSMTAVLGADRPGKPVVFGGHIDTVHPKGSWKNLFDIDSEGIVRGPGVYDMKGGLVVALNAVKALNSIGYQARPIRFVVSGDEEINHTGSTCASLFEQTAKGAAAAFNMESAESEDLICTGRKGNIRFYITIHGLSTHCAVAKELGAINANHEMAYKITEIDKITNWDIGTSVNVGVIQGGTAANTISDCCKAHLDIRFTCPEERDRAVARLKEICETSYVPGTKTELTYDCIMDVFETKEAGMRLFNFVDKVSQKHGLGKRTSYYKPGGSDAAYFARAGAPALCACGMWGNYGHTMREYAVLESLYSRSKLWAAVIEELNDDLVYEEA